MIIYTNIKNYMKFNNFKAIFATLAVSTGLVISNGAIAQDISHHNQQVDELSQVSVENYVKLDSVKEKYVQNVVRVYDEVLNIKEHNYSQESFQVLKDKIEILESFEQTPSVENFDEKQILQMSLIISKNFQKASQKMQITQPLILEVVSQTVTLLWPDYMEKTQLKDQVQRVMVENSIKAKLEATAQSSEMITPDKDNLDNKISNLRTQSTISHSNKFGM